MPELDPQVARLFGPETFMSPGRVYGGLPPGGPSMIPDECVIRVDCRPQPGVTTEQVRAEIDRCLAAAARRDPRFRASVELADVKSGYLAAPGDPVVTLMTAARVAAGVRGGRSRGTEPVRQGWLGRHRELRRQGADGDLRPRRRARVLPGRAPVGRRHHRGDPGVRRLRRALAARCRGNDGTTA